MRRARPGELPEPARATLSLPPPLLPLLGSWSPPPIPRLYNPIEYPCTIY